VNKGLRVDEKNVKARESHTENQYETKELRGSKVRRNATDAIPPTAPGNNMFRMPTV